MSSVAIPGGNPSPDRIRRELDGLVPIEIVDRRAARIASFGPEWIDTKAAARMLCCSVHTVLDLTQLERRPASHYAKHARGVGALYRRADIERLLAIRARCGLRLSEAARVLAALKQGGAL